MAQEQQCLKNELNQTFGLRNRKQKGIMTLQFDARISSGSQRTRLPITNNSIKNQIRYYLPRKGTKNISYAFGNRPDDHQIIKSNFFQDFYEGFSKGEQSLIIHASKNVAKHHATNAIITSLHLSPMVFVLGTILLNLGGSLAQVIPGVNDTWTLNNYTVTEGPSEGSDWCYYYPSSSSSGTVEYEFCNQFMVSDQSRNTLLNVVSYFGADVDWSGRAAELDPPAYCQTIFQECRSVSTVLEQVKKIFNLNNPSLFDGFSCMDIRNVPVNLCPSVTYFSYLSDEGCYLAKGCDSVTTSSIFSKCIDQRLINVTLDANDTMIYDPWIQSTDCPLPPSPIPLSSSTGGFTNQTLSDAVSGASPWGFITIALSFCLIGCCCFSFVCDGECNRCAARRRSQRETKRRIKQEKTDETIARELLMTFSGSKKITSDIEDITTITLSYLYDQSKKPSGFHNMLYLYPKNKSPTENKEEENDDFSEDKVFSIDL